MQGLLQRLHRLHIQTTLESEADETGIRYPQVLAHAKKIGFSDINTTTSASNLKGITNKDITDTIQLAKEEAISSLKELGMSVKEGKWEDVALKQIVPKDGENDDDNDDEDEDDTIPVFDSKSEPPKLVSLSIDEEKLEGTEQLEDIKTMNAAGFVDEKVVKSVDSLQRMKRIPSSTTALHDVEKKIAKNVHQTISKGSIQSMCR